MNTHSRALATPTKLRKRMDRELNGRPRATAHGGRVLPDKHVGLGPRWCERTCLIATVRRARCELESLTLLVRVGYGHHNRNGFARGIAVLVKWQAVHSN